MKMVFEDPINIVGLGCAGTRIVHELIQRGRQCLPDIHVWDKGHVEPHNCGPQLYETRHIGMRKVDAMAEIARYSRSVDLITHHERVDGRQKLFGTVFMCVDSMSDRWINWEGSIRKSPLVNALIEVRLEQKYGLIHVVNPNDDEHIRMWERYWHEDPEDVGQRSCGGVTEYGPIASTIASLSVWQLIGLYEKRDSGGDIDSQIRVYTDPLRIETYRW